MIPILDTPDHRVLCGSSLAEHDLPDGIVADALIVDAPFSARTHRGHNASALRNHAVMYDNISNKPAPSKVGRPINYTNWTASNVTLACRLWVPRTRGWCVSITDHTLVSAWEEGFEGEGLYVFAPLPWYCPGSRIRLTGDGPSTWTCWIVVARPRHEPYSRWGTLPGGYLTNREHCDLVGGKPLTLMRALVRDYSREGDIIWDPCCGAGSTLIAARAEGRRSLGMEIDRETAELAARRVAEARQEVIRFLARPVGKQKELL